MINFKVTCDHCKREVSTLDAVVLHRSCLDSLLREEKFRSSDRSTEEFSEFIPKVSEAELMSDAL